MSVKEAKLDTLIDRLYECLIPLHDFVSNSPESEAAEDEVVLALLKVIEAEVAEAQRHE